MKPLFNCADSSSYGDGTPAASAALLSAAASVAAVPAPPPLLRNLSRYVECMKLGALLGPAGGELVASCSGAAIEIRVTFLFLMRATGRLPDTPAGICQAIFIMCAAGVVAALGVAGMEAWCSLDMGGTHGSRSSELSAINDSTTWPKFGRACGSGWQHFFAISTIADGVADAKRHSRGDAVPCRMTSSICKRERSPSCSYGILPDPMCASMQP